MRVSSSTPAAPIATQNHFWERLIAAYLKVSTFILGWLGIVLYVQHLINAVAFGRPSSRILQASLKGFASFDLEETEGPRCLAMQAATLSSNQLCKNPCSTFLYRLQWSPFDRLQEGSSGAHPSRSWDAFVFEVRSQFCWWLPSLASPVRCRSGDRQASSSGDRRTPLSCNQAPSWSLKVCAVSSAQAVSQIRKALCPSLQFREDSRPLSAPSSFAILLVHCQEVSLQHSPPLVASGWSVYSAWLQTSSACLPALASESCKCHLLADSCYQTQAKRN